MKKDSFLKGTLIASIAIVFTKILGVLYVIPFYKIIGENGGVLYSYAYNIYNLFLNISTAGIPIAISMIISEYITLGKLDAKERTFNVGKKIILTFSCLSFLVLFIFSDYFAMFLISGIEGANPVKDISLVIKAISISLIITPYISVLRGYLQGHKFIAPGSISQVFEQVIRIAIILIGSYLAINVFNTSIPIGVSVALLGAFFGALGAYIYLRFKINKNKKLFEVNDKKDSISSKEIGKKIVFYCIPLIIISITNDLYTIVDMKLIIKGLYMVGFSAEQCELISSIVCTWAPKICMIISAISMGLITSLIPHIIESYTKKDYESSNKIFNQAISTMLVVALPLVVGIIVLSKDVYNVFYGISEYGPKILIISTIVSIVISTLSVMNTALQGFKKFKLVIISTVIGLVVNAVLDIPMILLLDKLGLTPYFGTSIATIIGGITSMTIVLVFLKKRHSFKYFDIIKSIMKTIIPLVFMTIIVIILNNVLGSPSNKIFIIGKLGIIGIIGMIVYLTLMYKNKGLTEVFGEKQIDSILKKIHLK